MDSGPPTITQLLVQWSSGDQQALDQLTPLVYDELRQMARTYLRRERPDHTLQGRILVNHALARAAAKRGGDAEKLSLDEATSLAGQREVDLISLDEALKELELLDPEQTRIVELRFFGGLSIKETAEVLKLSPATVKREWGTARLWLRRKIAR